MDYSDFYLSYYYKPQKGILSPFDSSENALTMERSEDGGTLTIKSKKGRQGKAEVKHIPWRDMPKSFLDGLANLEERKESFMAANGEQWFGYLDFDTSLVISAADLHFRHHVDGDGMGAEASGEDDASVAPKEASRDGDDGDEDDLGVASKPLTATDSVRQSKIKQDLLEQFKAVLSELTQF